MTEINQPDVIGDDERIPNRRIERAGWVGGGIIIGIVACAALSTMAPWPVMHTPQEAKLRARNDNLMREYYADQQAAAVAEVFLRAGYPNVLSNGRPQPPIMGRVLTIVDRLRPDQRTNVVHVTNAVSTGFHRDASTCEVTLVYHAPSHSWNVDLGATQQVNSSKPPENIQGDDGPTNVSPRQLGKLIKTSPDRYKATGKAACKGLADQLAKAH